MLLLDDIALLPVRGLAWVFGELWKRAEEEYYNPEALKAALAELEVQKRSGGIGQADYEARASVLFERLAEAARRLAERAEEDEDEDVGDASQVASYDLPHLLAAGEHGQARRRVRR